VLPPVRRVLHTYIAREKLIKGAKALGHNIRVETQGTIGTENELLTEDISQLMS
jgi:PTS system fructose-specific IIB component